MLQICLHNIDKNVFFTDKWSHNMRKTHFLRLFRRLVRPFFENFI